MARIRTPTRAGSACLHALAVEDDESLFGHLTHGVGRTLAGVAGVAQAAVGLLVGAPGRHLVDEHAAEVQAAGIKVRPEIMIPLVGFPKELELQIEVVHQVAARVQKERNVKLSYLVGTMIEIPRACVVADEIAKSAQFFSFGTNDLTQTTLGMSRDDAGSFLPRYQEEEIVRQNPFAVLDQGGVGKLMETAVKLGRATRKDIKLGICGEHGGEPDSVKFCHQLGLAYVSCSPFRLPIARLAAAQAALKN